VKRAAKPTTANARRAIRLQHVLDRVKDMIFAFAVHVIGVFGTPWQHRNSPNKVPAILLHDKQSRRSRIRLSGRGAVAITRSRISAKPVTRLPDGFDTNWRLLLQLI